MLRAAIILLLGTVIIGCDDAPTQAWIYWSRVGTAANDRASVRFGSWGKLSAHSSRAACMRRFPAKQDSNTPGFMASTIENKQSIYSKLDDGTWTVSEYQCWPVGVIPEA